MVSSYDPAAMLPPVGSAWIWEPPKPWARERVVVEEVSWNGEEWWVRTMGEKWGICWNDLGVFTEACTEEDTTT